VIFINTYIEHPTNKDWMILQIRGNKIDGDIIFSKIDLEKLKIHQWYIKDKTKENHRNYVAAKIGNKTIKLHRYILDVYDRNIIVDHDNRDTFNNTRENLIKGTSRENNLNTKMRSTNTSGRTGVHYHQAQGTRSPKWVGTYVDSNGTKVTKSFSIKKYGNDEAFKLAEEFRLFGENQTNIKTDKVQRL
jgi:hypothetical protein